MNPDVKKRKWINDFAKQMISEIFVMINSQTEESDPHVLNEVLNTFLANYVGSLVLTALNKTPSKKDGVSSKKELLAYTQKNLIDVKRNISEAISMGMEAAVNDYCGQTVEYYCTIKAIAETKSKRIH